MSEHITPHEEQIKEAQIVENINPSENTVATETQAAGKPKMSKKKLAIIAAPRSLSLPSHSSFSSHLNSNK